MKLCEASVGLLIVGWFYLATGDYDVIHMRGPFLNKELCERHAERYVPRTWENTGCKLKAINFGDEKDISPVTGKEKEA